MSNAAAPARAAVSRAAVAAPRRGMAGGPPPKYTGWEAQVREKLPKDEHVSCYAGRRRGSSAKRTVVHAAHLASNVVWLVLCCVKGWVAGYL